MKKIDMIASCMKGIVKPLKESKDEAFAQGLSGDGVLITPAYNKIISPFNGKVVIVFETNHAIILRREEDGLAFIIHVGIDTMKLGGGGFHVYVKDGEDVKVGDILMEIDFPYLETIGYNFDTHILFPSLGCRKIFNIRYGEIDYMEPLCEIK